MRGGEAPAVGIGRVGQGANVAVEIGQKLDRHAERRSARQNHRGFELGIQFPPSCLVVGHDVTDGEPVFRTKVVDVIRHVRIGQPWHRCEQFEAVGVRVERWNERVIGPGAGSRELWQRPGELSCLDGVYVIFRRMALSLLAILRIGHRPPHGLDLRRESGGETIRLQQGKLVLIPIEVE